MVERANGTPESKRTPTIHTSPLAKNDKKPRAPCQVVKWGEELATPIYFIPGSQEATLQRSNIAAELGMTKKEQSSQQAQLQFYWSFVGNNFIWDKKEIESHLPSSIKFSFQDVGEILFFLIVLSKLCGGPFLLLMLLFFFLSSVLSSPSHLAKVDIVLWF